jgi:hypothetical protein
MTRTSRAAFPRAVNKDRSESRSGLDKSIRKSGAGYHNWGSLADEEYLEYAALDDEQRELEEERQASPEEVLQGAPQTPWYSSQAPTPTGLGSPKPAKPESTTSLSSISDDELESAKEFRKKALKDHGPKRLLFPVQHSY